LPKPIDEFTRDRTRKDGLREHCRPCQHAIESARHRQKIKSWVQPMGSRTCTQCHQEKDASEFYRGKAECKACSIQRTRRWQLAHPEQHDATAKSYREANGDTMLEKQTTAPSQEAE